MSKKDKKIATKLQYQFFRSSETCRNTVHAPSQKRNFGHLWETEPLVAAKYVTALCCSEQLVHSVNYMIICERILAVQSTSKILST